MSSRSRPTCRSECREGPRPCPWLQCRYHLWMEERYGSVRLRVGAESCALDIAERGDEVTFTELGELLGVSQSRAHQICADALTKLRVALEPGWRPPKPQRQEGEMQRSVNARRLMADVKAWCKATGTSGRQLAKKAGIPNSTLKHILRCDGRLSADHYVTLCAVCGLTAGDYVEEPGQLVKELEEYWKGGL